MLATLCELVHEALGERTVGVVQGTPGFQRSHQGFWDRKLFADNDGDQRFDHRAEFSDAQVHVGVVELGNCQARTDPPRYVGRFSYLSASSV